MSKKKKQKQKSRPSEEGGPWVRLRARETGKTASIVFPRAVHGTLVRLLSNLRLSLTLRIALHFSGQLLRTTLPVLGSGDAGPVRGAMARGEPLAGWRWRP